MNLILIGTELSAAFSAVSINGWDATSGIQVNPLSQLVNFYRQGTLDISFEEFQGMDFDMLLIQIKSELCNLALQSGIVLNL